MNLINAVINQDVIKAFFNPLYMHLLCWMVGNLVIACLKNDFTRNNFELLIGICGIGTYNQET